jgi:sulfatase maturation enzyme AslB (radical SAM superfamily)
MNSSLWESEDAKQGIYLKDKIRDDVKSLFINEVVKHIEHLDEAYFAGGEPLLMEEHYEILEELIRRGRTDIILRYNTNLSVLKFKDKNVLDLWNKFDHKIQVSASLDHFGKRAEYIRHGTNWDAIEKNMTLLKNHPNVLVTVNTVLSVFNFLTLPDFYHYMFDNGWYTKDDYPFSIYMMAHPSYLSGMVIPSDLKDQGLNNIDKLITQMRNMGFQEDKLTYLHHIRPWATSANTWEHQQNNFRYQINRLDNLRSENFRETFPELAVMLD